MEAIGEYEILGKIADGGMGSVYKARRRGTDEIVAVKVLAQQLVNKPVLRRRFEKEYNAARQIEHENLVRALDFGYEGERPYIVMEYVDGESLGDRLAREKRLSEKEAIRIIAQVARGLYKAHKHGLVHRDVKPDNILIARDGTAKLTDMGLVKESETDINLTRTGRGLGTPHFMAPEQFRDAKNADVRCDIYSLGATLYMMVTGELPFKSLSPIEAWTNKLKNNLRPPRQIVPQLSERIDWAIRRAMHSDPEMRPADCREFVEDLTGVRMRRGGPSAVEVSWHIRYVDSGGRLRTAEGTLAQLRERLSEGDFGEPEHVEAALSIDGPFEPLRAWPEFRDIALSGLLGPSSVTNGASRRRKKIRDSAVKRLPSGQESVEDTAPRDSDRTSDSIPFTAPAAIGAGVRQHNSEWQQVLLLIIVAILAGVVGFLLFTSVFS